MFFLNTSLGMNHIPDISMTSSDLPAAVRKETLFSCPGALREGDWGPGASLKRICHACVPGPDPLSPTTSPDCSLSAPTSPAGQRLATCRLLHSPVCPSEPFAHTTVKAQMCVNVIMCIDGLRRHGHIYHGPIFILYFILRR